MVRLKHIPNVEVRAALLSLVVGALILAIKFVAYWLTESSAIFSDAVESIVNVMASCFALWALSVAHAPPDAEHPYGHGKVEFMSAGFEGAMILVAAVLIFFRTIDILFFHTIDLQAGRLDAGLLLVILAMAVNAVVGLLLIRTGKRHNSLTLEADGHHLMSDAVTSIAALAALLIVKFTHFALADPIMAILIASYIAFTGLKLVRRSVGGLMDEQDREDERILLQILNSHMGEQAVEPRICSYHKLRHRHSGRYHWVDFHMVVPAGLNVAQGHEIASRIEHEMQSRLGEGNATAHVEPCRDTDCATCAPHTATAQA